MSRWSLTAAALAVMLAAALLRVGPAGAQPAPESGEAAPSAGVGEGDEGAPGGDAAGEGTAEGDEGADEGADGEDGGEAGQTDASPGLSSGEAGELEPPIEPSPPAAGGGDEAGGLESPADTPAEAADPSGGEASEEDGGEDEARLSDDAGWLGDMPEELRGPPDRAVGLAAPIPIPAEADEELVRDIEGFQRALEAYQAEVIEYREDLSRLVRMEHEQRREDLQSLFDHEIESLRDEERAFRVEAIERLEAFIERYPNRSPQTPDALFRLAELYFETESDAFVQLDQEYTRELELYDLGRIPDPPTEPEKDYSRTVATFRRLIGDFPDYRQIDGAYYLMGYALLQMDREADAVAAFRALVRDHADSDFAQEAWVRIGEYNFERNAYTEAAAAYGRALDHGEGRLYDEALFKLGWSYYLINRYTEALDVFRQLIAFYDRDESELLGALREEALQYMAVVLAEDDWDLDGVRDAEAGMPRVRDFVREETDWEREVAERLANVWFDNEQYDQAIEAFRFILQTWPNDRLNPQRHERIVAALSRLRRVEDAFDEQRRLAQLYGPGSEWFRVQEEARNMQAMAYAEELTRNTLLDSARYYNEQADLLRDRAAATGDPEVEDQALSRYQEAAEAYANFLEEYPNDREAYEVRFLYAQALYYSFDFVEAANQYRQVRDAHGRTERQELAAYQVIKSLEFTLLDQIEAGRLDPRALPTYRGERRAELEAELEAARAEPSREEPSEGPAPEPIPELTLQLVADYDRYVELGLNPEDDPTTQGRFAFLAARVFFDFGHFEEARTRFQAILEDPDYRCQEEAVYAASYLIDSYRLVGDYESMELWGSRIQEMDFCEGQMDVAVLEDFMEEAETMRVGAIFRSAEDLFDAEDYEAAAQEYVRLVNQNPESEFAAAALYNAAVGYERLERFEPAMRLYQRLVEDYPGSEFVNNALYRVALDSRRFFDFERAIDTYLVLADRAEEEARAKQALFAAAELQEYSEYYPQAAQTFETFASRFPGDENSPLALYRAGLSYQEDGRYAEMEAVWDDLRRRYGTLPNTEEVPIDAMVLDTLQRTGDYYAEVVGNEARAAELYEEVVREFRRRDPTDVDSRYAAGKALFYLAERDFLEWQAVQITGSASRQRAIVQDQIEAIPELADRFNAVIELGSAEWTMAAYFMVGRIYQAFADKMYSVPIPDEIADDDLMVEAYQLELEDFASRFEDEAVANWRVAIEVARNIGIVNEWTIRTIRELNRYLGTEFPLYKEEREYVEERIISPLPFQLPEGIEAGGADELEWLDEPGVEELEPLEELDTRPPRRDRDSGVEELEPLEQLEPLEEL